MVVRLRVRYPGGTRPLEAEEDWTVGDLVKLVQVETGIENFTLKAAYPPFAALNISDTLKTLKELKLGGSTLLLTPAPDTVAEVAAQAAREKEQQERNDELVAASLARSELELEPAPAPLDKHDNLSVDWPEKHGKMVLRVMADDNSCLFSALGLALLPLESDPVPLLRKQIADYILAHPQTYTKAMLDNKDPIQYTRNLRGKDFWGGSIEMSVLSTIYHIQIVAIDVKTGMAFPHGQNTREKCLVLYSGIHYDRIVLTQHPDNPPEADVARFDISDHHAITHAKQLAAQLRASGYYTDTNTMLLRCVVPGCDWIGEVKSTKEHYDQTRHEAFDEIPDK